MGRANKYVEEAKPWELNKDPARVDELNTVLYNLAETLRVLAYLAYPFTPRRLREPGPSAWCRVPLGGRAGRAHAGRGRRLGWGFNAGDVTRLGELLFPRLDKAAVLAGA